MSPGDYGIRGQPAPELVASEWRGPDGSPLESVSLADLQAPFKLLYFFQGWCPGCHQHGFPTLRTVLENTGRDELQAVAVQTVFEGYDTNVPERAWKLQQTWQLGIAFGHDGPKPRSRLMGRYRTGGTPWLVLIGPDGRVLENHFHMNADAVVQFVKDHVSADPVELP